MRSLVLCSLLTTFRFCVIGFPQNETPDIPECLGNEDCPQNRVCSRRNCVDPCVGVCGSHTVCHVINHVAMCECSLGHTGHPATGCVPSSAVNLTVGECLAHDQCPPNKACVKHKCEDPCTSLCGNNTLCTVRNHMASCVCQEGYTGNPLEGCQSRGSDEHECDHHDNCPSSKACITNRCLDPCPGVCGSNASCSVKNHLPSCACLNGYTGDPFTECKLQASSPPLRKRIKKFKIKVDKTVDWKGAILDCIEEGKRLVAINSMEESNQLKSELNELNLHGPFWTSGNDKASKGKFMWATTGERLQGFQNWFINEPNNINNNEDCVTISKKTEIKSYGWNDEPCDRRFYYICEYYEEN